jgi:DNA-3-methyladenine glycosylase I
MTYCEYIAAISGDQLKLHKEYQDNHYGFPLQNDDQLFDELIFEINQAGINLEKSKNKNEEKGQTD